LKIVFPIHHVYHDVIATMAIKSRPIIESDEESDALSDALSDISDAESDVDSEAGSEADSEAEVEDTKPSHLTELLDKFKNERVPTEDVMLNPRNMYTKCKAFLEWKIGGDAVVGQDIHCNAKYTKSMVRVKHLLNDCFHESNLKRFCMDKCKVSERDLDKEDTYIKIDDLVTFYTDHLHTPSPYYANHKKNTVGEWAIHMPAVYFTLGIPIRYNDDFRPDTRWLSPDVWNKVRPKQDEWDMLNATWNYVMYHPTLGKYRHLLPMKHQKSVHGKKYDGCIGDLAALEHNEPSNSHSMSENDKDKVFLATTQDMVTLKFDQLKFHQEPGYIKSFFTILETTLIHMMIDRHPEFADEYMVMMFVDMLKGDIKMHQADIAAIERGEIYQGCSEVTKEAIIATKKKAIKDCSLLLDDKDKQAKLFYQLYQYKVKGDLAAKNDPDDTYATYILPVSVVCDMLQIKSQVKKVLQEEIWQYTREIPNGNKKVSCFSWDSVVEFINEIKLDKIYELKVTNMKLLLKMRHILEHFTTIRTAMRDKIIQTLKYDFSDILKGMETIHNNRVDAIRQKHKQVLDTKNYQIKMLQQENAAYDSFKEELPMILDIVEKGVTFGMVSKTMLPKVVDMVSKETYAQARTDVYELVNIAVQMDKEESESAQNIMALMADMEEDDESKNKKIDADLKKAIMDLKEEVFPKEGIKEYKTLATSIRTKIKDLRDTLRESKNRVSYSDPVLVPTLNYLDVDKPMVIGTKKPIPFPIVVTNSCQDMVALTQIEGTLAAFGLNKEFGIQFYEKMMGMRPATRADLTVPYAKLI
jgi:hypothetical protein